MMLDGMEAIKLAVVDMVSGWRLFGIGSSGVPPIFW
jgi:hypothetical protein